MDFLEIGTVKSEKAMAMRRYRRIRKIAILFRFFEVCLVLFFVTWSSSRLPVAARISGDFFLKLCNFLVSPRFIFFFGNAIVLTLVAKSGQFSGQASAGGSSGADLYDEFLKNSESHQKVRAEEEIVCETKAVIVEKLKPGSSTRRAEYGRSVSEGVGAEKRRDLRRWETDGCRRGVSAGKTAAEVSDEEFRRTIEEFIAKEQRFRREESMAIFWTNRI